MTILTVKPDNLAIPIRLLQNIKAPKKISYTLPPHLENCKYIHLFHYLKCIFNNVSNISIYCKLKNSKTFNLPCSIVCILQQFLGPNYNIIYLSNIFNNFSVCIDINKLTNDVPLHNISAILVNSATVTYCNDCASYMQTKNAATKIRYCDDCGNNIPINNSYLCCISCKKDKCKECMEYNKCQCSLCQFKSYSYCPYPFCHNCCPQTGQKCIDLIHRLGNGDPKIDIKCNCSDGYYAHWWKTAFRNDKIGPFEFPIEWSGNEFLEMWRYFHKDQLNYMYCKSTQNLNIDPAGYFYDPYCKKNWCTACIIAKYPLSAFKNFKLKSHYFDFNNAHPLINDWIRIANTEHDPAELKLYLDELKLAKTSMDWQKCLRKPKSLHEYLEIQKIAKNLKDVLYKRYLK